MESRHPFRWLAEGAQKRAFVFLLIFTLVVIAGMQALGGALNTEAAPQGIVSFEFAGDLPTAQKMLASWGAEGQVRAGLNLGLDYVFMTAYAATIGLGCVLMAGKLEARFKPLATTGTVLAWGMLAAALLDALENYALIRVLLGSENALWPAMARTCAGPKFLIVAVGLVYLLLGAVLAQLGIYDLLAYLLNTRVVLVLFRKHPYRAFYRKIMDLGLEHQKRGAWWGMGAFAVIALALCLYLVQVGI